MSEAEPRVLTVEVRTTDEGVDLVLLSGELDFSSGEPLSTALAALADGRRRVVVDVGELEFVDSSGVRILVAAARSVEDAGGAFVVAGPTGAVKRVLEILHLDEVVTVVDDRAAALGLVASHAGSDEGG